MKQQKREEEEKARRIEAREARIRNKRTPTKPSNAYLQEPNQWAVSSLPYDQQFEDIERSLRQEAPPECVSVKKPEARAPNIHNLQGGLPLPPNDYQFTDYSSIETNEDDSHDTSYSKFHFPADGSYESIRENSKRIPLGWTCDSVTGKYAYVFMMHKEIALAIMKLFCEYPKLNNLKANCYGKLYRSTNCIEDAVFTVIKNHENNPIQIDFALKYLIHFGIKLFRDPFHVIFHKDPIRKLGREEFDELASKCGLSHIPNKYIQARYFGFEDNSL